MAKVRLRNVINRWNDGLFYAYTSSLPPASTIDDVHRNVIARGTFDKSDLNTIISHYTKVDPASIRESAQLINAFYQRLDEIDKFTGLEAKSNQDIAFAHPPPGTVIDENDAWYDPNVRFGVVGNNLNKDPEKRHHLYMTRFNNEQGETGYEIEFWHDDTWSYITFNDPPSTP